jgi:hypothetical protein
MFRSERVDHTNCLQVTIKTHSFMSDVFGRCRSTRFTYVRRGLRGGLEHLKIVTRLIDERFESVMVECPSILNPMFPLFYYESRKRESKTRLIY